MLELFVVYDSPSDFPGKFVVRRHFVTSSGLEFAEVTQRVRESLEEARAEIPKGRKNIGRHEKDDPAICEVWV